MQTWYSPGAYKQRSSGLGLVCGSQHHDAAHRLSEGSQLSSGSHNEYDFRLNLRCKVEVLQIQRCVNVCVFRMAVHASIHSRGDKLKPQHYLFLTLWPWLSHFLVFKGRIVVLCLEDCCEDT